MRERSSVSIEGYCVFRKMQQHKKREWDAREWEWELHAILILLQELKFSERSEPTK